MATAGMVHGQENRRRQNLMNEIKESWATAIRAKAERWDAALEAARLELNVCDAIAEMEDRED